MKQSTITVPGRVPVPVQQERRAARRPLPATRPWVCENCTRRNSPGRGRCGDCGTSAV